MKVRSVKFLATLMSICYLANPLHRQINGLLHGLSHSLEIPHYVMSHDYDTSVDSLSENHAHDTNHLDHSHHFIDILDLLFEASKNDGGSGDSWLLKSKFDKHLGYQSLKLPRHFETTTFVSFPPPKVFLPEREPKQPDQPPKNDMG